MLNTRYEMHRFPDGFYREASVGFSDQGGREKIEWLLFDYSCFYIKDNTSNFQRIEGGKPSTF